MSHCVKKIFFLATLFFLIASATLWAQVPGEDWTRIAVFGGSTRAVAVSPNYRHDDTVFVGVEGGGVWRSTDRGAKWTHSTSGAILAYSTVVDLAISPDYAYDGTVIALTASGRIYRSTNAGGSFSFSLIQSIGSNGTALAISPNFPSDGVVFAADKLGGLWYSTDHGSSFTYDKYSDEMSGYIYCLAISPDFYLGHAGTLLIGGSSDKWCYCFKWGGGGSWTARSTGLGQGVGEVIKSLAFKSDDPDVCFAGTQEHGMWKSSDTGQNWTNAEDGSATFSGPEVRAIACHRSSTGSLLLEGRSDSLRSSTDIGTHLEDIFPGTTVNDIEFENGWDNNQYCEIYVATPHGLFRLTCAGSMGEGPKVISGYSVALSGGMTVAYMGSDQGLYKSYVNQKPMTAYNNFPNGCIPNIVDICLDPNYYEDGTCGTDDATMFVAANFPDSPADNGVYKSTDFGNSWTKMIGGHWPSSSLKVNCLAISPGYSEGGVDTTLYVATSDDMYRWDGTGTGWTSGGLQGIDVDYVAVPPTYDRSGSHSFPQHTVFIADEYGLFYSVHDGIEWIKTGYPVLSSTYKITGIEFPADFGTSDYWVYVSSNDSSQNLYYSQGPDPWLNASWYARNSGLPSAPVFGMAACPGLAVSGSTILAATYGGVYYSDDKGSTWNSSGTSKALSVAFDPRQDDGRNSIAGYILDGAGFSSNNGHSFDDYTGYSYLPDDVWATVAHERNPNVLFASSPTYGVFVSEDRGISFRPWNLGKGGSSGPCVIRHAYGLNMLANRRNGTNKDIVWAGTLSEGIKTRYIYYDSTTGTVDLDTEDGATQNGWRDCTWSSSGAVIQGRWNRIEVQPGTGQSYPVWATGQTTDGGFANLPAGPWWSIWKQQNGGLPGGTTGEGVRLGYDSSDPVVLESGSEVWGQVAQSNWDYYYIDVPAGSTDLYCFLDDPDDGGQEDADMYIRYGALPTTSTYDYCPYINGDEEVCIKGTEETLFTEDFEGTWGPYGDNPPAGWTIPFHGSENPNTWNANDWYSYNYGGDYGHMAKVYYTPNETYQNEGLLSPAMNVPETATQLTIEFDERFYPRGGNDTAYVYYTSDRHPGWTNIYSNSTLPASTFDHTTINVGDYISDFAGDTNVKFLFYYYMNPANTSYGYWEMDNVTVKYLNLDAGRWYIGVNGYQTGNNAYGLTATVDSGCTESFAAPSPRKEPRPARSASSSPTNKAPSAGTIWGTSTLHGVVRGTDSGGSTTWSSANGTGSGALTNLNAQTVLQLSDLTVIAGCDGGVFYSPAPDEGATIWVDATPNVASSGSNDFTDIIESPNHDLLIAANGTGTGGSAGGVWLSGDKGGHWMKISSGFDSDSQALSDLMVDSSDPPQYYSSTNATGVYTRTITASPYPVVTGLSPNNGPMEGGTTVTATGTGFSNSCPTGNSSDCPDSSPVVIMNGAEITATDVNSTTLTFVTPAGSSADYVNVYVRNPDTRLSAAGPAFHYNCANPSAMANNSAVDDDPYKDTGVYVSWTDPSEWGDGGSGTRSFGVYRNGVNVSDKLASSTHGWTDTTGTNGVTYTYTVRAYNGCGSYTTSAGTTASDEFNVPEEVPTNSVKWSSGAQLTWQPAIGAEGYRVYRGNADAITGLPTSGKVCQSYEDPSTSSGEILAEEPASGKFFWYLVAPYNGAGEGSVGTSRVVSSTGDCASP